MRRSGNPSATFRRLAGKSESPARVPALVEHYRATKSVAARDKLSGMVCRAYNEHLCDAMGWSWRVGTLTIDSDQAQRGTAKESMGLTVHAWSGPWSAFAREHLQAAGARTYRMMSDLDLHEAVNHEDVTHAFEEVVGLLESDATGAGATLNFCLVTLPPRRRGDDVDVDGPSSGERNSEIERLHALLQRADSAGIARYRVKWKPKTYRGAKAHVPGSWPKSDDDAALVSLGGLRQNRHPEPGRDDDPGKGARYTVHVCRWNVKR